MVPYLHTIKRLRGIGVMKKRIYGAGLKRINVTLSEDDKADLRKIGGGNVSEGIRILVKRHKQGEGNATN